MDISGLMVNEKYHDCQSDAYESHVAFFLITRRSHHRPQIARPTHLGSDAVTRFRAILRHSPFTASAMLSSAAPAS